MQKKPYNKTRYPFLEASYPENPLPCKKLNRKGIKLNNLSNKRGLTNRIQKIQKSIIEQERVNKIYQKTEDRKQNFVTADKVTKIHHFIKYRKEKRFATDKKRGFFSFVNQERLQSQTTNRSATERLGLRKNVFPFSNNIKPFFHTYKYMFSLQQLKAEFYKKKSQYKKSSVFKNLLEERKKCSLIYGCLGGKQIQKIILQANRFDGKFDENFIKIVESRLDVVLFRICFFPTIFSAKQWIHHSHVRVNNSVISLPGYQLKAGDIITISPEKVTLLKKKISSLIAEKIKIRSCHYLIRMDTFYTVLKNLVSYQNKNDSNEKKQNLDFQNKKKTLRGYNKNSALNKTFFMRKETGKLLVFLKNSYNHIFKGCNKKKVLSSIYLLPKVHPFSFLFSAEKKMKSILLPFLKYRNLFTSARPLRQRVTGLRISGMKPLNLEVCYKNMVAIFLYSPQKVALPTSIDLHFIAKTFQ